MLNLQLTSTNRKVLTDPTKFDSFLFSFLLSSKKKQKEKKQNKKKEQKNLAISSVVALSLLLTQYGKVQNFARFSSISLVS